ncbi:MAG: HlyD family efflux transporter periplasmic adaptor subunit [Planctomycetota bacterium]
MLLKWISRVFRGVVGIGVILIALAIFGALSGSRPTAARSAGAERPLVVVAMAAAEQDVERVFEGYGTARALDAADVAAEVAARVIARPESVEAGEPVGAGNVLVDLDPGDFEARARALRLSIEATQSEIDGLEVEEANLKDQVRASEAELDVARRELERAKRAESQGALNESETDQRLLTVRQNERALASLRNQLELIPSRRATLRSNLESRRADLNEAERNVERTTVISPFEGVLQSVAAEVGEYLRVGDTVARVVDLSVIEVPIRLPISAGGKVGRDDVVELRPEADPGTVWTGRVTRISPEADERSRSIEVFVEVEQDQQDPSGALLLPGRFVLAKVWCGTNERRLITPRRTVTDGVVLIAEEIDLEAEIEAELARFDDRLNDLPPETAQELAAAGAPARRAWLLENDARLKRLAAAKRPTRVREAEVLVDRYIDRPFPGLIEGERQWAVLTKPDGKRSLSPGQYVLMSNLDQLRVGMEIDVRLPGDAPEPQTPSEVASSNDAAATGG